ncbi:MAG TPA: molybdenum cofactor sulfurase [Bauldia sp.]|nr:molybdenum cofactor sulfurase [Bauldia sp.]
MSDLFGGPQIIPRKTVRGRVVGTFAAGTAGDLTSVAVDALTVDLAGVRGDRHYGFTRKSGAREPWYPRGTEIRSGRQVTVVSVEELAEIARRLELPALPAQWIGANIAVEGVASLSYLPSGTRLFFPDGASLVVEAINAPCRDAGRAIVRNSGGSRDLELAFPKVAGGLRGVVASVERAGTIVPSSEVQVRIPEQRLYA